MHNNNGMVVASSSAQCYAQRQCTLLCTMRCQLLCSLSLSHGIALHLLGIPFDYCTTLLHLSFSPLSPSQSSWQLSAHGTWQTSDQQNSIGSICQTTFSLNYPLLLHFRLINFSFHSFFIYPHILNYLSTIQSLHRGHSR